MDNPQWYDANTFERIPAPKSSLAEPFPFQSYGDGAAEALLTTLIDTWREDVSSLFLDDGHCKWFLYSAVGPGDARGYVWAPETTRTRVPVILEIKHEAVTRGHAQEAAAQALVGLDRAYKYAEELKRWHGCNLDHTCAQLLVASAKCDEAIAGEVAREVAKWVHSRVAPYPSPTRESQLPNLADLRKLDVGFFEISRWLQGVRKLVSVKRTIIPVLSGAQPASA